MDSKNLLQDLIQILEEAEKIIGDIRVDGYFTLADHFVLNIVQNRLLNSIKKVKVIIDTNKLADDVLSAITKFWRDSWIGEPIIEDDWKNWKISHDEFYDKFREEIKKVIDNHISK